MYKNFFLNPIWTSAWSPTEKTHMEKNNNFESSDKLLTGYRLKTVCCFVTIGNWLLHHIKAPCQVGAFGRSTMSEYFFPLMFTTPYSLVSPRQNLRIVTVWQLHTADVPHWRVQNKPPKAHRLKMRHFRKDIWSVLMFVLNKKNTIYLLVQSWFVSSKVMNTYIYITYGSIVMTSQHLRFKTVNCNQNSHCNNPPWSKQVTAVCKHFSAISKFHFKNCRSHLKPLVSDFVLYYSPFVLQL